MHARVQEKRLPSELAVFFPTVAFSKKKSLYGLDLAPSRTCGHIAEGKE
jgi:hypothetical protein